MQKIKIEQIKIPYAFTQAKESKILKKVNLINEGRVPVVTLNTENILKDGYATFLAYQNLGYTEVPFVQIESELPTREYIIERDKNQCYICNRVLPTDELTIDHVVPRLKGGDSTENNLKCCCKDCNQLKGNFSYSEKLAEVICSELMERGVKLPIKLSTSNKCVVKRYVKNRNKK
jgi:hypothetical protein